MNFQYLVTNIIGPGCGSDQFHLELPGCECEGTNCDNDCTCLRYGRNYDLDTGLLLAVDHSNYEDKPIFECGSTCRCALKCGNRLVQFGIQIPLDVFETGDKGHGLRTLSPIKKGQFVCEYAGEVIDLAEASKRFSGQRDGDPNYIFVLREHSVSTKIITCIDPTHFGNLGRFINHSCDPNLLVIPVRYDTVVPHLCFFANRDIDSDEELSYDYGGGMDSKVATDLSSKPCHCKATNCRRFLPLDMELLKK